MKRGGILAVAFCLFAGMAHAQANINEGQETATLYVDVVNGNDNNSGAQNAPFKTIAKSVAVAETNNRSGIGTHVYINPGLYRENIDLVGNQQDTTLPETFEAATPGTVLISGADQYTNWTQTSGNSSIYSTPWTFNFGVCPRLLGQAPLEPDIHLRREMAFINGVPLQQVLTMNQMLEGTFYVDDTGEQLYIWPPSGTNLSTADVELGDRGQLWAITNKNGVVLRGLTFEYSADCVTNGAVEVDFGGSQNVLFDTDNFFWNNATGLHLFSPLTHYTVENVVANHNGSVGINPFETTYGSYQNVTADFNNWRGEQSTYYSWGAAGINIYGDVNDTHSNITTDWNLATGIHWDTNFANISAASITSRNNLMHGVQLERNTGPMSLTQVISCNNVSQALLANGATTTTAGIALRDSENVTLTNSFVYGNGNAQFDVIGIAGGIPIPDWQTGQIITVQSKNFTITNNVFESTDGTQDTVRDAYLGGADWTLFQSTLTSGQNTWWNPVNDTPFVLPVPVPSSDTDFPGWQAATGQDLTSTFAQPSGNQQAQCVVPTDGPDLWVVTNNVALTLDPSGQATATYSYIPVGGFTGDATLTLDTSQIPGLSATIAPTTIPNSSGLAVFSATAPTTMAPGTYQFTVLANSGSTTRMAEALFYVPQTSLRLSPSMNLNFGTVTVGQKSAPQTLTITNFGTKAVTNLAIGAAPAGFSYTKTCGTTLSAGKSCTVTITFAPNAGLSYSPQLTITDSDPTSPQTVTLTGQGTEVAVLSFSKLDLVFGSVIWNTTTMLSSVVTNTGTVPATFSSFNFSGTGAQYFKLTTNTCAEGLNPGDMCTLTVGFTPGVLTQTSPTLTIVDNVKTGENTISMSGTGKTSVTFTPQTLSFGAHKVGTNTTKTVTFTNAGNPLAVTIKITGKNPSDFSYATTCPPTVPKSSCTTSVIFTPLAKTSASANLTFTDADPTSPQTVTLTGTGS